MLHSLLVESLEKVNDAAQLKLTRLKDILDDITTAQLNPQMVRRHPLNISKGIYDNVNNLASETDGVVLDVFPQYQDADLSVSSDVSLDQSKSYTDALYSSTGRVRTGVTEIARDYQTTRVTELAQEYRSTEDYVHLTEVSGTPVMTQQLSMSPSISTSRRPEEKQVNRCWDKMVRAAEMVNGTDRIDLITFVDDADDIRNSSLDSADQVSVSQLSTVASSGYQSIGYSQSNSPVDTLNDRHEGGVAVNQAPLSFSNPLFGHCKVETESVYRSPPTAPQDKVFRSPSSSSLSSDDGASRNNTPSAFHTHPKYNGSPASSHSRSPMPAHKLQLRSLDRRIRTGSSSSADSLPTHDTRHNMRLHRQCATHQRQHNNNPHLSKSQPRVNENNHPASPILSSNQLSRSVDLSSMQSPPAIKRAGTESGLGGVGKTMYTPPESPHFGTLPPTWRTPTQSSNVRMGMRSVSHRQTNPEKSKSEVRTSIVCFVFTNFHA